MPNLTLTERDVVEAILLAAKIEAVATGKTPETILNDCPGKETSLCGPALEHIKKQRVLIQIV